jgi:hypothetical protein
MVYVWVVLDKGKDILLEDEKRDCRDDFVIV